AAGRWCPVAAAPRTRAAPRRRRPRSAWASRRSRRARWSPLGAAGAFRLFEELAPAAQALHEILVRRGADDAVELRPVVADEADVLDEDVVDQPAVGLAQQARLDRHLRLLSRHHLGADDGVVAVDLLLGESQPPAAEAADLRAGLLLGQ